MSRRAYKVRARRYGAIYLLGDVGRSVYLRRREEDGLWMFGEFDVDTRDWADDLNSDGFFRTKREAMAQFRRSLFGRDT